MRNATLPDIRHILAKYSGAGSESLITVLQEIQAAQGYLSQESMIELSRHLNVPASQVYGVATFYNQFRFEPSGKHTIHVCRGTACHVKGSARVLAEVSQKLGIEPGTTTSDGQFSLGVVACVGACGLAPVINIDNEYHAEVTPEKAVEIIDEIQRQDQILPQ